MADEDDFQLLPADDLAVDPDADVEAAAASALAPPLGEDPDVIEEEAPEPFGRTWLIDFEHGRLVRRGGSPVEVRGIDAFRMVILAALHTGRGAHPVFTDDFGMDGLEEVIGGVDIAPEDFEVRVRDALLTIDRVAGVEDWDAVYDAGVLTINRFTVISDDEERISFGDLQVPVAERQRGGLTEDA